MNAKIFIIIAGIGVIFIFVGLAGWLGFTSSIIHNKISEQLYIRSDNESESYKFFKKLPVPLTYSIWMFEINQSTFDGVHLNTLKYKQKGPYVFDEYREKEFLEFSSDGTNVTYRQKKNYIFNKNLSCPDCNNDDRITMYNIFHSVEQEDLDKMIKISNKEQLKMYYQLNYTDEVEKFLYTGSDILSRSILGDSYLVEQVVHTGKSDINKIGQYLSYDGYEKLQAWPSTKTKFCNELKGTDATQFQPELTGDETIWIFEPLLCAKFYAKNKPLPNVNIKGIPTLRYVIQKENFAVIKENVCYCLEDNYKDCKDSLLNLRTCAHSEKFEILASPGFYYTVPSYLQWTGLNQIVPQKNATVENYGTFIDIEPLTGIVLQVRKSLMLNIKVRKNAVPALKNLEGPYQVAPLFYMEGVAVIDDANADKLKEKLFWKKLINGVFITMSIIGLILVLIGIYLFYRNK